MEQCTSETTGWCLDRRINVPTILTVLSSLAAAIAVVVSLQSRLDVVEQQTRTNTADIRTMQEQAVTVARMGEKLEGIAASLNEIKQELRQELRRQRDGRDR